MSSNRSGHREIGSSGHRKTDEDCRAGQLPALTTILFLLATVFINASTVRAQATEDSTFTEQAASKLLNQVVEGLNGRTTRKMLSAFDLNRMNGGAVFKGQISAFFNQTDSIRVHFNLREVTDNVVVVDAEMDVTSRGDLTPPQHKSMQLRFTGEKGRNGWKFIDVQPRSFFSQSS